MDSDVFNYLEPSEQQKQDMATLRGAAATYAQALETALPAGADKTYLLRKLREVAMWANVAVTRREDGSPRKE
jgi:hypothetical protein